MSTKVWKFPLAEGICPGIPVNRHPGSFGVTRWSRRRDCESRHTGVDLYACERAIVTAVRPGIVTGIENFTGPSVNSPWWLPTKAMLVDHDGYTVCYGEIAPRADITVGYELRVGEALGEVVPVLKEGQQHDEIPGHSRSMLHLELYARRVCCAGESWLDARNRGLMDPTDQLLASWLAWNGSHLHALLIMPEGYLPG